MTKRTKIILLIVAVLLALLLFIRKKPAATTYADGTEETNYVSPFSGFGGGSFGGAGAAASF